MNGAEFGGHAAIASHGLYQNKFILGPELGLYLGRLLRPGKIDGRRVRNLRWAREKNRQVIFLVDVEKMEAAGEAPKAKPLASSPKSPSPSAPVKAKTVSVMAPPVRRRETKIQGVE